jgi:hypothetical protein
MTKKINLLMALMVAFCSMAIAQTQMVTFQVENPANTPVYVFGSWSGWGNYPGNPMTMIAPGKYSATLPIASNTTHEYLFVSGATPANEALNSAWTCTNGNSQYTNRVLVLGATDTAVCYTWATCNTCVVTPPPPPPTPINVTFQVMSPDSTPVSLIGSWNWSSFPGANMSLIAPNKYSVTIPLMPNSPYEFLYVNGVQTKEGLNPAWTCTNGNAQYTNRTLALGANDTTLCFTWATCTACPVTPPPTNINVKFAVQSPDSTPVYVFGSWNNWNNFPGELLTYNTTNGTHEKVLSMLATSSIEYLYVNGIQTKEVLNPAWPCTNGNGQYTNRIATLGTADTSFCSTWQTCNGCTPLSIVNKDLENISLLINTESVKIVTSNNEKFDAVEIYDIVGKRVALRNHVSGNENIPVTLNANSLYIIHVKKGNNVFKVKAIIKN